MTSRGEMHEAGHASGVAEFLDAASRALKPLMKVVDQRIKSENHEWPPGKVIRAETYDHGIVLVEDGWRKEADPGRQSGRYLGRRLLLTRDGAFVVQERTGRWDPEAQVDGWEAHSRQVGIDEAAAMVADPADLVRRIIEKLSKGAEAVETTAAALRKRQAAFRSALDVVNDPSKGLREARAKISE